MIIFRLVGEASPITIIPGRHSSANDLMVVYNGKRRELRYCPNESSIWADEQNKKSKSSNPMFKNGEIKIDESKNPTLIEFLRVTPLYGKMYKEINIVEEAAKKNAKTEMKLTAMQLVRDASEKEILDISKSLFPVLAESNPSVDILKDRLYDQIEMNPEPIIRGLSTQEAKEEKSLEALVKDAVIQEVVAESENKKAVIWTDSGAEILTDKHHAKSVENALIAFLSDPENVGVYNELKAKVRD